MSTAQDLIDIAMRRDKAMRGPHAWLSPGLFLPLCVIGLLAVAIAAPQFFTGFDPEALDTDAILEAPNAIHWFGTDELGRDIFARVVHGAAQSLGIGVGATLVASLGGVVIGTAAALAPQPANRILTRLVDLLLAFPEMLLALLVIAVLGRGPTNTLLAVGLAHVAGYARLVRSQVLQIRLSGYVEHAVILGEHPVSIVVRHIIPNAIRPLVVLATIGVGSSILAASALSFLGLGVVPPAPEWGALLASGRNYLDIAPWASIAPASVVALSVISITLFGRRLQALLARGSR